MEHHASSAVREPNTRRSVLKLLGLGVCAPNAVGQARAAVESDRPGSGELTFTFSQGNRAVEVHPFETDQTISEFYDKGYGGYNGPDLHASDASTMFFLDAADGLALVFIHDEAFDNSGGAVTMDFTGLPDGEWVVTDDRHDFDYSEGATITWSWNDNNTDGGAYRGDFASGFDLTIDPHFNEAANRAPLTPGEIVSWNLVHGDMDSPTTHTFDMNSPLTVRSGTKGATDLDSVIDDKLNLASHIDSISFGLADDVDRVRPVAESYQDAVATDELEEAIASETINRMRFGETLTDTVLAAGGPGRSEYTTGEDNLSELVARFATYPVVDLAIALLPIPYALRNTRFTGSLISAAESAIQTLLSDTLRKYFPQEVADYLAEHLKEVISFLFDKLIELTEEKGAKLTADEYRALRDEQLDTFIEDEANVIFTQTLFGETFDYVVGTGSYSTEPVHEGIGRLIDAFRYDGAAPALPGTAEEVALAAKRRREAVNEHVRQAREDLDFGIIDDLIRGMTPILDAVEIVAAVVGVITKNPYVIAYELSVSFINSTLNTALNLIKWGLGWTYLRLLRDMHMAGMTEIIEARPMEVAQ